jgi:hypothetical protein
VTERLCPRCHTLLPFDEDAALVFCWSCGAPQVRLSEELLARANPHPDPSVVVWKSMIRIAAAVCAFFILPSIFLLPLSLLVPPVVLQLYASRFRGIRIGSALGTRVGVVCGVFMTVGISLVRTIGLLLYRFTTNRMLEADSGFSSYLHQLQQQATARNDAASLDFLAHFTIPEFRVGVALFFAAVVVALFLILSAASGAFAGFVRSRTQTR